MRTVYREKRYYCGEYWGIYDALTAGNLLWYGSFTRSKNVLNGDAITVSAGAIVCTLA